MNWDDLRIFDAVAETGSLTGAARQLGVDHATVGRRLAALEAGLGVRLVDRLPRGTPLTTEGAALAEMARSMRDVSEQFQRRARDASAMISGTVTISATRHRLAFHRGEARGFARDTPEASSIAFWRGRFGVAGSARGRHSCEVSAP